MWSQTKVLSVVVHSEYVRTVSNIVAISAFPVGLELFVLV